MNLAPKPKWRFPQKNSQQKNKKNLIFVLIWLLLPIFIIEISWKHCSQCHPNEFGAKLSDSGDFPNNVCKRTIRRIRFLLWSDFFFLIYKRNLVKSMQPMPSKWIWRKNQSDDFPKKFRSRTIRRIWFLFSYFICEISKNTAANAIQINLAPKPSDSGDFPEIIKENNLKNLVSSFDVLSSASCFKSEISWKHCSQCNPKVSGAKIQWQTVAISRKLS